MYLHILLKPFQKNWFFLFGASDPLGNIWGKLENYHSFCRFVACRKNKQVWKAPYITNKTLATTLNWTDSDFIQATIYLRMAWTLSY